ncbi:hypothetical protein H7J50_24740 [Mycobacterium intermedium]|uniref:hypothetical protein n=1 Tax=Mycobacterium intermedium TaxID=28445 RepID=UPI0009A18831|nr:hypothetical protein [Mycobacterium intermedium]MCV6966983.1 hypothetical protein [Mycobacterium intermedium]
MTINESLPIPPMETATDPVHSASDLRERWRALMGPLGFGERLLWIGFLGPDRRLIKTLTQVPIGPSPRALVSRGVMSGLQSRLDDLPAESTVALLLTGPGRGGISPSDRQWAKALTDAAAQYDVPLLPIFRANDEAVIQIEPA